VRVLGFEPGASRAWRASTSRVAFQHFAAWHRRSAYPNQRSIMGLKDDVTGKAKEAEGKLTGDKSREAEGNLDQAKGKAKDAAADIKDAAKS
jgi:uncharacterized protein YjbJ (UPF0337 family)